MMELEAVEQDRGVCLLSSNFTEIRKSIFECALLKIDMH